MARTRRIPWLLASTALAGAGLFGARHYVQARYQYSLTTYVVNRILRGLHLQSWSHRIVQPGLSDVATRLLIKGNQKRVRNPFLRLAGRGADVEFHGMQVFIWNDREDPDQDILLYLHGGGYVRFPLFTHLASAHDIGVKSGAKIVMPVYPKAPEYTFRDAYPPVVALYKALLSGKTERARVHVGGDSAGGGFALGLSYYLAEHALPQPDHLILISPWLNLRSNHADIGASAQREVFFDLDGLHWVANLWAGSDDALDLTTVSPIHGDPRVLTSQVTLTVGTDETFYADARDFAEDLKRYGIPHRYIEGVGQHHCWPLFPTPEARRARAAIADAMRQVARR